MRRCHSTLLALLVAAVVHTDWHLARPTHHRLSLGWPEHWLFAAAMFAVVGCVVARRWPQAPWRAAAGIVAAGLVIAQVVEPLLEALLYEGRLGYDVEPERWRVFFVCVAAGVPALALAVILCRPRAVRAASRGPSAS